ncbi:hypothetical protein F5I97DRAFT_1833062 [Phlebopus sp. FC_14]|nr:hypothetical protein F5I97DRAFT_1833062 [Phlebopus sp. FC_14]
MDSTTFANPLGMEFVGLALATWLFGVNTVQAFEYFMTYNDRLLLKLTVVAALILDLASTILTCWGLYLQVVVNFGRPPVLNLPLVILSAFIVQCVYRASERNKTLTLSILMGNSFYSFVVALTQLIITATLVLYFWRGRSHIGSVRSCQREEKSKVCRRTIASDNYSVLQILLAIFLFSMPNSFIWVILQSNLNKTYTLTFLAILNRRECLRRTAVSNMDEVILRVPMSAAINGHPSGDAAPNIELNYLSTFESDYILAISFELDLRMHRPVKRSRLKPYKRPSSSLYGAHHVPSTPELIDVTFVLYIFLWQLEKSSSAFAPISRPLAVQLSVSGRPQAVRLSMKTSSPVIVPRVSSAVRLNTLFPSSHVVESLDKSDHSQGITWPPIVTHIPEDTNEVGEGSSINMVSTSQFEDDDSIFKLPCRKFLLPVRIGEQESKARQHLLQLATLARELNRTLVLPNVGRSRLGVSAKWPFETYYDAQTFAASRGFAATMQLADFRSWTHGRQVELTSHFVSMKIKGKGDHAEAGREDFTLGETEIDPKLSLCLEAKLPDLRLSSPTGLLVSFKPGRLKNMHTPSQLVQLFSGPVYRKSSAESHLANPSDGLLPDVATVTDFANVDVIVVDYDLRYPIFNEPSVGLSYALPLYDLADKLAETARPFLAVHWRMEGVPVQNLAWCAVSLINVLRGLLEEGQGENIRSVWFATDYPLLLDESTSNGINGRGPPRYGGRKSSTFKTLTSEHDDAVELVKDAFRPGRELDAYRLTDLSEQLLSYSYTEGKFDIEDELLEDSGIHGILDKLVTVQSQIFVSGSEDCSKTSSFSKQIIDGRQEAYTTDTQKVDIRNVVEYFGEW